MSNFCKHCGVKLEGSPSVCPSCNQKLNLASELLSKKSLDELKQGLMSASSKAVSIAKDVGADIASETKKINEARKEATEASDFKGAEDKKAAVKNGVLIFWTKLTAKQKIMLVAVPILLMSWMLLGSSPSSSQDSVNSKIRNAEVNGTLHRLPSNLQPDGIRNLPEGFKVGVGGWVYANCGGKIISFKNSSPPPAGC